MKLHHQVSIALYVGLLAATMSLCYFHNQHRAEIKSLNSKLDQALEISNKWFQNYTNVQSELERKWNN